MKISLNNEAAVTAALRAVNGRANEHVYRDAADVRAAVADVESDLRRYGVRKSDWRGVLATLESGDRLPNSYKYAARSTLITLERGAGVWFLTGADASEHRGGEKPFKSIRVPVGALEAAEVRRRREHHLVAVRWAA